MLDYATLKAIHVTTAVLSIAGFTLRYGWMIAGSTLLGSRAAKVLPHIVDTLLLASAISLAVQAGVAPWTGDIGINVSRALAKGAGPRRLEWTARVSSVALFADVINRWYVTYSPVKPGSRLNGIRYERPESSGGVTLDALSSGSIASMRYSISVAPPMAEAEMPYTPSPATPSP